MTLHMLVESFSSPSALLAAVSSRPCNLLGSVCRSSHAIDGEHIKKAKTADFDAALAIARAGYPDGVRAMRDACGHGAAACSSLVEQVKRSRRWSVSGESVSVARALSGAPRCFCRTRRESVPAPGLRLVFDGAVSWGVSPASIIAAGGRMVALVDALRMAGVAVSLAVGWTGYNGEHRGGEGFACSVDIARAGESVPLALMAYWCAHPSAWRRVVWAWMETVPGMESKAWRGGYGFPGRCGCAKRDGVADDLSAALLGGAAGRVLGVDDLAADSDVPRLFRELTGAQ